MSLNIKNEEVHRLVEELARITGESQTSAVRHAVEEKLAKVKGDPRGRVERLMRIAADCAKGLKAPYDKMPQTEIDDMLYDERGLPK